jgi:hypothetical protein
LRDIAPPGQLKRWALSDWRKNLMKYLLTLLTVVFTTVNVCSQTLPKDAKAEREILAFQKELSEAMNRKDRAMLERLIADGFTFIHSTGGMENRKEYIDNAVAEISPAKILMLKNLTSKYEFTAEIPLFGMGAARCVIKLTTQLFSECETFPFTLRSPDGGNWLPGSQPNCRFARRQKL